MGSKSRIAKHIVPIIQRYIDENNIKCYIEPFCGGLNVIDKVKCEYKIASDIHRYLIALFKNIDKIYTLPDFITKEHYSEVRECFNENNNCLEDWYIGAIRFLASYNGRFFDGGYAGLVNTKSAAYKNCYDNTDGDYDNYRPIFWYRDQDKIDYENAYGIVHSKCYTEYGLKRTGCVGCPYGRDFENELEVVQKYEPKLYKAVCNIFKDSYEYTRKYKAFVEDMKG